jgi:hypothetical protein
LFRHIPGAFARFSVSRGVIRFFLLAFCLILLAAACRRAAPQWGDQALLSGNAVLDCSAECAARGQCGTSAERGQVVLLTLWGPDTHNHDLAIATGTAVTVLNSQATVLVQQATAEEFLMTYYQVNVPGRAPGWVAGWCLRTP